MADRFGGQAVVWRYDPILVSDLTPVDWHRRNFLTLARQLNGAVDEVVCSFAQLYRKTERNLSRRMGEGSWRDPPLDEKRCLLFELSAMAAENGMRLTLCTQPALSEFSATRCIDGRRLSASETESFGLSMLEAMSCGVPCVSTAVGGVEEVLGTTGLLVR